MSKKLDVIAEAARRWILGNPDRPSAGQPEHDFSNVNLTDATWENVPLVPNRPSGRVNLEHVKGCNPDYHPYFKAMYPDDKPSVKDDIAQARSASVLTSKDAPTQVKTREGR